MTAGGRARAYVKRGQRAGTEGGTDCARTHSPAEDAEDEVEHEEGADHNEGDEVDDVESVAHGVVELRWREQQS